MAACCLPVARLSVTCCRPPAARLLHAGDGAPLLCPPLPACLLHDCLFNSLLLQWMVSLLPQLLLRAGSPHSRLANRCCRFTPPQARVLATMTEGGSEDRLFYGAAGQFVDKLAEVGARFVCALVVPPLSCSTMRALGWLSRRAVRGQACRGGHACLGYMQRLILGWRAGWAGRRVDTQAQALLRLLACTPLTRPTPRALPTPPQSIRTATSPGFIATSCPARHIAHTSTGVTVHADW